MRVVANLVNLFDQTIYYAEIGVESGKIAAINNLGSERSDAPYVLPGFIDAHVHIESSMLTPAQFARLAVVHGTVATVSDPHEIGNVLGVVGVKYMIEDGKRVPFKFCFGAPSCVPATIFETAGASISSDEVHNLLAMKEIGYLAEMMNFPGVLHQDPEVMRKIQWAQALNKPIDGHAPGLRGADARQYANAGISTDHECFTYDEGLEKIQLGMHILIREGSAAKNFEALIPLLDQFPNSIMFCSDDKHPDSLAQGHINELVKRALSQGYNLFDVLRAACLNPALHYRLPVGLLRVGDPADCIVIDNWQQINILATYIDGQLVAQNGQTCIEDLRSPVVNQFECLPCQVADLVLKSPSLTATLHVIEALDGQLITNALRLPARIEDGAIVADPLRDILKIVVVNRYKTAPVQVGFITNFGLQHGAIASSVAHDSHNIIAVGCDDVHLAQAINLVIAAKGGIAAVSSPQLHQLLPLPIAGLMSDTDGYLVAKQYTSIDAFVKNSLGSKLTAPFMTLSFMGLLVIPSLKMSDLGLFDGQNFSFCKVVEKN